MWYIYIHIYTYKIKINKSIFKRYLITLHEGLHVDHTYTHAVQHTGLTGIQAYRQTYADKLARVKAKAFTSDLKAYL